jgi:hypothetical protein
MTARVMWHVHNLIGYWVCRMAENTMRSRS